MDEQASRTKIPALSYDSSRPRKTTRFPKIGSPLIFGDKERAYTAYRGSTRVLETATHEKRKREELKAKRELLFERYLKHPMDAHLSLEIKSIDDQLAEPTKQVKRKTRSSD